MSLDYQFLRAEKLAERVHELELVLRYALARINITERWHGPYRGSDPVIARTDIERALEDWAGR